MMKYAKILGLALTAVFVLGTIAVSSASATLLLFQATEAPGTALAKLVSGKHKFATEEGTVECEVANGEGSLKEKLLELILIVIKYEKCEVTGIKLSATVTPADFLFHANGDLTLDNLVKINAGGGICTINVESQVLSGVTYENASGSPMEVEVKENISSMTYEASGALCPKKGKFTNGTYTGTGKFKEDGGEICVVKS